MTETKNVRYFANQNTNFFTENPKLTKVQQKKTFSYHKLQKLTKVRQKMSLTLQLPFREIFDTKHIKIDPNI